ncbi:hypothetical protein ACEPU1_28100 [Pseudomonas aeruginosa]|jgi:hypothetical protein|nr:hypothetical protein [Pseudomonas aeruginosa]
MPTNKSAAQYAQEIIEKLAAEGVSAVGSGLFCHSTDPNDHWTLRLSESGGLELHKAGDQSVTPILLSAGYSHRRRCGVNAAQGVSPARFNHCRTLIMLYE